MIGIALLNHSEALFFDFKLNLGRLRTSQCFLKIATEIGICHHLLTLVFFLTMLD